MKQLLPAIAFIFLCQFSFAQKAPDYSSIRLETKEDFTQAANDAALQASGFVLSVPLDKNNIDRLTSLQYVIRWMTGTPDYSFTLDEQATKFAKKNDDLLGLYMAAMVKYVLENKTDAKDQDKIKLNAIKMVIEYAKNPGNNVKMNGELKKAIEADDKGQLSGYLKIK